MKSSNDMFMIPRLEWTIDLEYIQLTTSTIQVVRFKNLYINLNFKRGIIRIFYNSFVFTSTILYSQRCNKATVLLERKYRTSNLEMACSYALMLGCTIDFENISIKETI